MADAAERRFAGLLVRKPAWRLSWRAWLLVLVLFIGVSLGMVRYIHSFLAVNEPVPSDLMIVEGWAPTITMKQAAEIYKERNFKQVLVVRALVDVPDKYESGRYGSEYMANLLIQYGVPKEKLSSVFLTVVKRDRTYHSALAAKEWLAQQHIPVTSLDVVTVGPHARRSRLMYEKAFGSDVQIGIIPLENVEYDPSHWWRTSEGVRETIGETIAYVYARCLFRASNE